MYGFLIVRLNTHVLEKGKGTYYEENTCLWSAKLKLTNSDLFSMRPMKEHIICFQGCQENKKAHWLLFY